MKTLYKFSAVLLIGSILIGLNGCGTTKAVTDGSSDKNQEPVIAELSSWTNQADLLLVNNPAGAEFDQITTTGPDVAPANSTVEVYKSAYFTQENLVATTIVSERGTFIIQMANNDDLDNQVFYVTCTEPGKRRSEPVILTKTI
jgi:hypothetical protein